MSDAPTLDSVYEQYGVTGNQRQPEQSAQQESTSTDVATDPVAAQIAALANEVRGIRDENEKLRTATLASQEKADLKGVLDKLSEKMEGVKSKHIKFALAERYEDDPKFKEVWDNRANNPEAFTAALDALTPVLQDELAVRADPKIAEDQKAFDNALQSADTQPADGSDDETHRLMKLPEGKFDVEWRRLINGG